MTFMTEHHISTVDWKQFNRFYKEFLHIHHKLEISLIIRCRRGRDGVVAGYTTTSRISAYHH